MDNERWYNLLDSLKEKLEIENEGEQPGPGGATVEWITFKGPKGLMKLERTSRPVILDRKMHYSKRAGGATEEELVLSETEKSYRVGLYVWSDAGGWEEVDFRALTE
ncbi:MAG: hypothetical protein KAW17_00620 [Candidatus Eisenbacteria sp.]|nr:hypothetical protein [Candidatus Eisenbacteria bacterium]